MSLWKAFAALVLALLCWEAILRLTMWEQPPYKIFPKGIVALPGVSVRSQEGFSRRVHVNEFGTFHSIRRDLPLIIFQGDSYTYAEQVATEENYSSLVRASLQDRFEVLNAGNFGMNVGHYIYNDRYFKDYNPVFHVIQVKYDDFFDSLDENEPLHARIVGEHLEFEAHRTGFMKWVEDNTYVYNLLNRVSVFSYFRDKYLQDINAWVKTLGKKNQPVSLVSPSFKETEESKEGKIRLQLKVLKDTYGDKFVLVYLPRNPVMRNKKLHIEDPQELRYAQSIEKLCDEAKVPLISMWKPFIQIYKDRRIIPSGFENTIPGTGHINRHGHQLVADEILKYLRQRFLQ